MGIVKGAALGAAMQLGMEFGLKGIWEAGAFIYRGLGGSDYRKLEQIVDSLSPIVTEICASGPESLPNPSLEKFSKFREKITEGNELIEEYTKSRMSWRKIQINERVKKLEKSINKFIQNDLQIVMLHVQVYISSLQVGMAKAQVSLSSQLGNASQRVETMHGESAARTAENTDDCMDVYSFSQHDVMRDLALYLVNQDNNAQCSRLYMPKMENCLSPEWETDKVCSSKAQIVSIHTGAMKESDWPKIEFAEVEALILYFTASEYCIPPFLHTMKNLKVLIIQNNDGAKLSKLSGLAAFEELFQLKALHLGKLIVPEECKVLKSLEKINMSFCEGLGRDKMFNFPELLEFNVSYCIDLEELPAGLCSSNSLKTLSVTHCHNLAELPDKLDELKSVKEIRLCHSLLLKELPSSICSLKKLKLLDISSCINLKVKRGEKETLQNLAQLASLKRVICDKKNEWLFKKSSRTDLKVQAVEEKEANLDWLDWEARKL